MLVKVSYQEKNTLVKVSTRQNVQLVNSNLHETFMIK